MVDKTIEDTQARVNSIENPALDQAIQNALAEVLAFCKDRRVMFHREITDDGLSIEVFPNPAASGGAKRFLWVVRATDEETGEDIVLADGAM